MAIQLISKTTINLGNLVNDALSTVRDVRNQEFARREADFQRAVAEGTLSYESQIKFRQKQLEDEKASPLASGDSIAQIEESIGTLKKLNRFQKIRDKYKTSLDNYVQGKGNINSTIDLLRTTMSEEQDEQIKNELRTALSSAIQERATLEKSALENRIKIATADKSVDLIDQSINEIKNRKSDALLADDPDTATMWDATLTSLRATRASIQVENAVSEINFQINKNNLTSGQKMGLLNSQLEKSDRDTPFVYQGVKYNSMRDYWEGERGKYIRTTYLTEVKQEIENETNRIAQLSAFGQVPVERIEAVSNFYKDLSQRAEFQPFAREIEQARIDTVATLANELKNALTDEANVRVARGENPTNVEAKTNQTYQALESRLGITLGRPASAKEMAAGKSLQTTVQRTQSTQPGLDLAGTLPSIEDPNKPKPAAPVQPVQPIQPQAPAAPTVPAPVGQKSYVVKAGDTLTGIAKNVFGDASRWRELKTDKGTSFDEASAKKLQLGTRFVY